MAIRPPCVMLAIMSRSASGRPDISRPTSKPSRRPSCCWPSAMVVLGDVQREGDADLAGQASRYGLTSVMTTLRAPACLATAAAMMPDRPGAGDQHVLADQREGQRGVHGVAERVEDRGDVEVDRDPVHPDVGGGQRDVLGERAVAAHAEADGVAAQVPAAGQAVAALAADQVALAADQVADRDVRRRRRRLDDLADELVAEDQRGARRACCAQASQEPDVQVGAADAGAQHLDQHLAGTGPRLGYVHEPQAGLGLLLDKRLHAAAPGVTVLFSGRHQSAERRPLKSIEDFLSGVAAELHTAVRHTVRPTAR